MHIVWPQLNHKTMPSSSASSTLDSYDLPVIVGMTRSFQMICCIIELLMIYSESGSLSMLSFLIYSFICGFNLFHIAKRWYYNIDGRYDLKQFVREREPTVRVQYGMAIFTPLLMGFLTYTIITLENGFVHLLFKTANFVQLLLAISQLILECYEVYIRGN
ncbi:hypothetical protein KIN20_013516 [Parelaphostrongylus tenuis]|uniref:DUF7087 domain-containing protein n=1 Tax=Parelaphostrongylus tenuis TaxID=148309 RepID=A0AAD5MY79_PARTN|nr:hypothetical protein KIN20_013516 [Parelaphostrongylus tenuis]